MINLLKNLKQFKDSISNAVLSAGNQVRSFNQLETTERIEPFARTLDEIKQSRKPIPRYNPEHVKEMAATVFGESSSDKQEMKTMIDTVLNRRNQLGLDIKEVLKQKDKHGEPMYRAYGGKEYEKYISDKLDLQGEPEKKKMLDELIQELQFGNWQSSEFTNFEKAEREGATKIGEHYFRKAYQGNRIKP